MEKSTRDVVEMSSAGIDFPGFRVAHTPEFDLSVVTSRNDKGKSRVEGSVVDTAIVSLENVFHRRKSVEAIECARGGSGRSFTQSRDVPYAYGLVL